MSETVTLIVLCRVCGKEFTLAVTTAQLEAWTCGELTQRAMPHLTAAERDLLISGTCDGCFWKMFPTKGEDEV